MSTGFIDERQKRQNAATVLELKSDLHPAENLWH